MNETEPEIGRGVGRRHLAWLVLLVVALVPLALIDGPAHRTLERWGWVDSDQRFTELYFPDHLALPRTATVGTPLAFDFSVHNLERSTTTYSWQVLLDPANGDETARRVVAAGELTLVADEVGVVHVEPVVDVPVGRALVAVALVGRTEAIHFPVDVEPATGTG